MSTQSPSATVTPSPSASGTSSATGSASPTPSSQGTDVLSFGNVLAIIVVMAITMMSISVVVIRGRQLLEGKHEGSPGQQPASIVRSLIALWLIGGLLVLCVTAFGVSDTTLRSTLLGGLTASVGAATAFYFATKSSDQARQDVLSLSAAFGTVQVPDLTQKTVAVAKALMAEKPLQLQIAPSDAAANVMVLTQDPVGGSTVLKGSTVSANT